MTITFDIVGENEKSGISSEERFGDPSKIIVASVFDVTATSSSVDSQIPEFVRQDHPKFVEFLKSYYDWMDIQGGTTHEIKKIKQSSDIDTAKDIFEEQLHDQFLHYFPRFMLADKATVLKHARQFYRSKGTENSFKFFFRALYNSPAEFYYPRQDILKLSDGKYIKQKSIRVVLLTGDSSSLQNVLVEGVESKTNAFVDRCVVLNTEAGIFYELFFNESSLTGKFKPNEKLLCKTDRRTTVAEAKVLCSVSSDVKFAIDTETGKESRGSGYQVDDCFFAETASGKNGILRVSSVYPDGSIRAFTVRDFGVNYSEYPFDIELNESTSTKRIKLSLSSQSFNFSLSPQQTISLLEISGFRNEDERKKIESSFSKNAIVKVIYPNATELTYSVETTETFFSDKIVLHLIKKFEAFVLESTQDEISEIQVVCGSGARLKVYPGVLCEYPGYYVSNNGQLSETKYLQDGEFYQQFSYVVYSKESAEAYRPHLKDMVHPLGLKFYGGFRDPSTISNKIAAPNHSSPVKITIQQFPRQILQQNPPREANRKSPPLDGTTRARVENKSVVVSSRAKVSKGFGACLKSIYRERFKYLPTENMRDALVDFTQVYGAASYEGAYAPENIAYWGNSSSPAFQYANTQIRHFKTLIPKSLERGGVPDILISKNGKILVDNVDYLIRDKSANPWNSNNYCIKVFVAPEQSDVYEVTFRDKNDGKIMTALLSTNTDTQHSNIIQIPHNVAEVVPNMRINIMPDSVVSRGIKIETTP